MTPEVEKAVLANLAEHEGNVRYIYPDSKGNPTVGKGHLLPNQSSAIKLPFKTQTGEPATPERIASAWNYVKSFRQPYRLIALTQADVDNIALIDLHSFDYEMNRVFPQRDNYPVPVQLALWDMVFNLGSFTKFPKFIDAVHRGDWKTAAQESQRQDIGIGRNVTTRNQLLAGLTLGPLATERLA
jgi:GH24 family phage-related lysozyme (muramidase)